MQTYSSTTNAIRPHATFLNNTSNLPGEIRKLEPIVSKMVTTEQIKALEEQFNAAGLPVEIERIPVSALLKAQNPDPGTEHYHVPLLQKLKVVAALPVNLIVSSVGGFIGVLYINNAVLPQGLRLPNIVTVPLAAVVGPPLGVIGTLADTLKVLFNRYDPTDDVCVLLIKPKNPQPEQGMYDTMPLPRQQNSGIPQPQLEKMKEHVNLYNEQQTVKTLVGHGLKVQTANPESAQNNPMFASMPHVLIGTLNGQSFPNAGLMPAILTTKLAEERIKTYPDVLVIVDPHFTQNQNPPSKTPVLLIS